ncbi:MAG: hypothetical protein HYU32_04520 [candidate division NC10 bacterium]|nr:hypothetical protein [candidate division NC10 bacterium]
MSEGKDPVRKKILIIDDEEDLCLLAAHALTMERTDLTSARRPLRPGPSPASRSRTSGEPW